MTKYILSAAVLVAIFGVTLAQIGCPLTGCPMIEYPKECQAESYMIYHGQACRQCTKCIDKDMPKAPGGCPVFACPLLAFLPKCTAKRYFIWEGHLCPDCDANICD